MPIRYKFDVVAALKNAGYTTYKIRKEKILSESVMHQLRHGEPVSWAVLVTLCNLLNCQPGDLLAYEEPTAQNDTDTSKK